MVNQMSDMTTGGAAQSLARVVNEHPTCDVSVVIPCFRSKDTVHRALASAYSQTLRPKEVLLVDDFSGDGTWEVLSELSAAYPDGWVKVLRHEKNRGPGAARNTGWGGASAEFVAFLDADDSWHPMKLHRQYSWMRANPQAVLSGHKYTVIEPGASGGWAPNNETSIEFRRIEAWRLVLSNRFSTPTVMLQRQLPHRFHSSKRHSEDYYLWCQIALDGLPCYFLNEPLAYLYKAPYGAAGLSSDLRRMWLGEMDTYSRLRESGRLSYVALGFLRSYSFLKYCRRVIKTKMHGKSSVTS